MIKIAIVDDHQMFLEGLKHIINSQPNFSVVYSNNNPLMFLEDFKSLNVDLVITDISMPHLNGIELINQIKVVNPEIKILVMSSYKIFPSKKTINAFLSKDTQSNKLINAIEEIVLNHQKVFDQNITFDEDLLHMNKNILTKKEVEIIQLIAQEKTTDEISGLLFVSKNTIETHRKNIFFKLNVKNVAGLIVKAEYLGYLSS